MFSHREMRELYYFFASGVNNRDQRGTGGKYKVFWILGPPTNIELRIRVSIRLNRKKLSNFLDAKWTDRYDEALEQATCIFPRLLIDPKQSPSKVSGNSSKTRRMLGGKQKRSVASWQCTQRNLRGDVSRWDEYT